VSPEPEPVFSSVDTAWVLTRRQLAEFVARYPESRQVEYKRLRELRECGGCAVCRAGGPEDPSDRGPRWAQGVEIARAMTALANGRGGVLVIGVKRTSREGNQHELETEACPSLIYEADWVTDTATTRIEPPPGFRVRQVEPEPERPPAFIVDVPAAVHLHDWKDGQSNRHFTVRREATSVDLAASEVEFLVKTKLAVETNAEFRNEIAYSVWTLYNAVLSRPADPGSNRRLFERVLRDDPLGAAAMDPPLRRWMNHPAIDRAILDLPAKMATWNSPYDLELAVETVGYAERELPHEGLDHRESRYLAACRIARQTEHLRTKLSPFNTLEHLGGADWEETRSEFLSSDYEESYESVLERVSSRLDPGRFDEHTKLQSIYDLSDALSLLIPLAHRVLQFYAEIVGAYGPGAVGIYGPEFVRTFNERRDRDGTPPAQA
jgi:hypothetical protein